MPTEAGFCKPHLQAHTFAPNNGSNGAHSGRRPGHSASIRDQLVLLRAALDLPVSKEHDKQGVFEFYEGLISTVSCS